MNEPKPFASLSPTLLARKGAAKPAMRPQLQPLGHYPAPEPTMSGFASAPDHHDDLGWNDMGESHDEPAAEMLESANVLPFAQGEAAFEAPPLTIGIPEVVRSRDSLAERIDSPPAPMPPSPLIPLAAHRWARVEKPVSRRSALADGRRAAFTLRVDGERHLKLRLACTVQGRSAQQLVTEALDKLLGELPELEDLARRVKRR